jgi:hypothetical protein
MRMANIDTEYLDLLIARFRGYRSPNETQRLIILLGSKLDRSNEDNKKLSILLKAEKAADKLMKARTATNKIMNAEKTAARKLDVRKKIIWGAALKTASETNPYFADLMKKLYNEGFVSDKDKDAVKEDYNALNS